MITTRDALKQLAKVLPAFNWRLDCGMRGLHKNFKEMPLCIVVRRDGPGFNLRLFWAGSTLLNSSFRYTLKRALDFLKENVISACRDFLAYKGYKSHIFMKANYNLFSYNSDMSMVPIIQIEKVKEDAWRVVLFYPDNQPLKPMSESFAYTEAQVNLEARILVKEFSRAFLKSIN